MSSTRCKPIRSRGRLGRCGAWSAVLFCLMASLCSVLSVRAAPVSPEVSLQRNVLALDSARATAVGELGSATLSGREISDYRDFLAYLNTRIIDTCRELQRLGEPALLQGLPCPSPERSGPGDSGSSPVSPSAAGPLVPTRAEQTGVLDEKFAESLGAFDDLLLEEEARVATRVPRQRETGDAAGDGVGPAADRGEGAGGPEGGEPGAEDGDAAVAAGESGGGSDQADESGAGGATGVSAGAASGSPAEVSESGARGGTVPPPEDDDIVARQLREAAEKETDPELKEKLWEEYRRYKGELRP